MPPSSQASSAVKQIGANKTRPGDILLSLLIPPIGLVLAVTAFSKSIKSKNKNRQSRAITLLVAALVGAAGYWYVLAINHNSASTTVKKILYGKSYGVNYAQLDPASLVGPVPGTGISFEKPVEFKRTSIVNKADSVSAAYTHLNQNGEGIGFLTVSSAASKLANDKDYVSSITTLLNQGQGSEYQKFISTFYPFVKDSTSPNFTITFSKPVAFTTNNIKGNAWQFDVSARSNPQNSNQLTPLKGKFYLIVGDKAFYYIGLYSLSYNWQPNQSVWQQVASSLKVDQ